MELIKSLLNSRKFIAFLIGIVIAIGGRYGLKFDPDLVRELLGLVAVFILGQGIADFKKEAAAIEKQAAEITAQAATQVARIDAGAVVQAAKEAGPTAPAPVPVEPAPPEPVLVPNGKKK